MTDHPDTAGATARPRLTPLENVLAFMKLARRQGTTMSILADDVKAVEDAINEHESLKARLAEVEGERDAFRTQNEIMYKRALAFEQKEAGK